MYKAVPAKYNSNGLKVMELSLDIVKVSSSSDIAAPSEELRVSAKY